MKIITLTCPDCGTIVADNVLKKYRVMKCPSTDCSRELRFDMLSEDHQEYILDNPEMFRLEE
jgi:hypothetical protein